MSDVVSLEQMQERFAPIRAMLYERDREDMDDAVRQLYRPESYESKDEFYKGVRFLESCLRMAWILRIDCNWYASGVTREQIDMLEDEGLALASQAPSAFSYRKVLRRYEDFLEKVKAEQDPETYNYIRSLSSASRPFLVAAAALCELYESRLRSLEGDAFVDDFVREAEKAAQRTTSTEGADYLANGREIGQRIKTANDHHLRKALEGNINDFFADKTTLLREGLADRLVLMQKELPEGFSLSVENGGDVDRLCEKIKRQFGRMVLEDVSHFLAKYRADVSGRSFLLSVIDEEDRDPAITYVLQFDDGIGIAYNATQRVSKASNQQLLDLIAGKNAKLPRSACWIDLEPDLNAPKEVDVGPSIALPTEDDIWRFIEEAKEREKDREMLEKIEKEKLEEKMREERTPPEERTMTRKIKDFLGVI